MSTSDGANALTGSNPTLDAGKLPNGRTRIPLGTPQLSMQIPGLPGYYLRWIKGTPARLAQVQAAGYEFVFEGEVETHNVALGGDAKTDGNTDLGSKVSIVEGGEVDATGNATRMYLMKQKWEYRLEDMRIEEQKSQAMADALTSAYQKGNIGGKVDGETSEDMAHRYVGGRTRVPELFRRKSSG